MARKIPVAPAKSPVKAAAKKALPIASAVALFRYVNAGGKPAELELGAGMRNANSLLEEAALEWTYILRSRQRWVSSPAATENHLDRALKLLHAFGISMADLQQMARAPHIEVGLLKTHWALRIIPWEYIIATSTRQFRDDEAITITRALPDSGSQQEKPTASTLRVLYVESTPAEIGQHYTFESERSLIDIYLLNNQNADVKRLYSPTPAKLRDAIAKQKPHIVHLAGVDSHEARTLQHWYGQGRDDVIDEHDGYILADDNGNPLHADARELATCLTADGAWLPWLVSMNLANSAARLASSAVQKGCHAAIGFQDSFDNALAETFFGSLYVGLARNGWNLLDGFQQAWRAVRQQPGNLLGTGVVLWSDKQQTAKKASAATAPETTWADPDETSVEWILQNISLQIKPKPEINYSLLHNKDDELFQDFSIKASPGAYANNVNVRAVLSAGPESAEYACSVKLEGQPLNLKHKIRISLGANLIRSVHEAINTTWLVDITWGRHVLLRETYPVRLLPVDQWRDARTGRSWLPSFVFPRDRAVCGLIAKAANYVRVLRDDPVAGFEGYQCLPNKAEFLPQDAAEVDLQVQAIWSAVLYEWKLTYINPPPTYSKGLDSQRLRIPSTIEADRHGTCIDLALLLAAALELVDIRPVIFLFSGHAFPGYWRTDQFHERFSQARPEPEAMQEITSIDADRNGVGGTQTYPWAIGRAMKKEILREIREGRLVPLETVLLTEGCGFADAIAAGKQNFDDLDDLEFLIDIAIARMQNITPLPLCGRPR